MTILLTAATPAELSPTLQWLRKRAIFADRNILHYSQAELHLVFTGMGTLATGYALGTYLAGHRIDLAIQGGIAGALDRELDIGQVVRVVEDCQLDFGAEDRGGEYLDLRAMQFAYTSPHDEDGWLRPKEVAAAHLPFAAVKGGTTNRSSGSRATIDLIRHHFPEVQLETMEGAAFFYACLQAGVKPLQLRAVSNYVTERDRDRWQIGKAIGNLDRALRQVLGPFIEAVA